MRTPITHDRVQALWAALARLDFKPCADTQNLYRAMMSAPDPDGELAAAKDALRAATLAGDQEGVEAAQAATSKAANLKAAWRTFREQRDEYARELARVMGEAAFTHVRELYDSAGARFAEALAAVDPDRSPAEVMATGTKAQRDAWVAVEPLVGELDGLSALLRDILHVCGRSRFCRNYRDGRDPNYVAFPLGLLVTVGDADPRRLSAIWTWTGYRPAGVNPQPPGPVDRACMGRAGRWGALVRYGATLEVPCASLAAYRPLALDTQQTEAQARPVGPPSRAYSPRG